MNLDEKLQVMAVRQEEAGAENRQYERVTEKLRDTPAIEAKAAEWVVGRRAAGKHVTRGEADEVIADLTGELRLARRAAAAVLREHRHAFILAIDDAARESEVLIPRW